jgi:hypothetical protein
MSVADSLELIIDENAMQVANAALPALRTAIADHIRVASNALCHKGYDVASGDYDDEIEATFKLQLVVAPDGRWALQDEAVAVPEGHTAVDTLFKYHNTEYDELDLYAQVGDALDSLSVANDTIAL